MFGGGDGGKPVWVPAETGVITALESAENEDGSVRVPVGTGCCGSGRGGH